MASSAWQSKGRLIGLDSSGIRDGIVQSPEWKLQEGSLILPQKLQNVTSATYTGQQVTKSVQIQEMRHQTPLLNGSRRKEFVAHFNLSFLIRETSQGRMAHSGKELEERC